MSTDDAWRRWGECDPYYGVITDARYRRNNLTAEAKEEFFDSGRQHVEHVLQVCRTTLDPEFRPARALDFGCGVGRVLLPLAEVTREAIGLDVSPAMLEEAKANCASKGLTNVRLALSDDHFTQLDGNFDLVHSSIVLQHIDVPRGRRLFQLLVERVSPGGIGAIQVTYAKARHQETFGQPPKPREAPRRVSRRQALKIAVFGEPSPAPGAESPLREVSVASDGGDPEMQMNAYSLSELAFILQSNGIRSVHVDFTDHGGEWGVFLFFRKTPSTS
jgi:SAM-dependent methyltransferase